MTTTAFTDRRTVLQTITAAVAGGSMLGGSAAGAARADRGRGRESVVTVTAQHDHDAEEHRFELDTHTVPAGWTTVTFDNPTEHAHFVYSSKIPEQVIEDSKAEGMALREFWIETVTKPFQYFMDKTYVPGKEPDPADNTDIYNSLFPPWFGDITYYGGPGLTSGGRSSEATVDLPPGEYILECYVKNGANDFHSYLGMLDLLTVTDDESAAKEPDATLKVTVDNDGLTAPTSTRPGQHTVAVRFDEQQAYSNLVGHDVHLVRLDGDTTAGDVAGWMDWTSPSQLIADGDEPGPFIGGVQDIWTGDLPRTGYADVLLKPGEYAWVAEVPASDKKGLLAEFSVPGKKDKGGDD